MQLTNQAHARVGENTLLITSLHILVVDRFTALAIDPPNIQGAVLEATVKMLDVTHHPCHLNASLYSEFPSRLHLPPRSRASPRPYLSESRDDHDLVEVNHAS